MPDPRVGNLTENRRTRNRCSKHRGSYFRCLFQRAEIQVNVHKLAWVSGPPPDTQAIHKHDKCRKLSTKHEVFPWESIATVLHQSRHNTRNYLRLDMNTTTNQRLSPHSRETGTRLTTAIHRRLSPRFFWGRGGGRLYTGYTRKKVFMTGQKTTNRKQRRSRFSGEPLIQYTQFWQER